MVVASSRRSLVACPLTKKVTIIAVVRDNYIRALAVLLVALAAATLAAVLVGVKPAEAAFPGTNSKIVFSSDRTEGEGVNNPEGDSEIFAMNPDGTELEQLTFNDDADVHPTWSDQGNAIAFASYRDGNSEIYWMIYGGIFHGLEVRLTSNMTTDENPAFNHDGTKIAFSTHRDFNGEIYVMDTSDTNGDGNGDNPTNLTKNAAGDFHPAFNHDGTKIAFSSHRGDGDGEIWVMDADGENPVKLTDTLITAQDSTPDWSPDGTKIAFSTNRDGNYNVYVMNADGTEQKRRTKKAADDYRPAFSPDGKKIAFTSTNRGGNDDEIYVMKATKPEGKKNRPKNLTNNDVVDDFAPDWRPIPQP